MGVLAVIGQPMSDEVSNSAAGRCEEDRDRFLRAA
jgi:hypothetical protein